MSLFKWEMKLIQLDKQSACYNDTRFLSKTQLVMINQSNAGRFDPVSCTQLTKTFGSKRPAFD